MMAARPIIMAVGAGNDMVEEAEGGISVPTGNPKDVAAAIEKLLAMSAAERDAAGAGAKAHVLINHAYPVLARQFLEAVQAKK